MKGKRGRGKGEGEKGKGKWEKGNNGKGNEERRSVKQIKEGQGENSFSPIFYIVDCIW